MKQLILDITVPLAIVCIVEIGTNDIIAHDYNLGAFHYTIALYSLLQFVLYQSKI